jgi:hypothetical protein
MNLVRIAAAAAAAALCAPAAQAVTAYDQNVTSNIIFTTGVDNGAFTTDRANGIELGLRGKLRFNESNDPDNIFNSNGDGTYTFQAGAAPGGFGFDPNSPTTPVWSFEFSINSNYDGTGGMLDDYTYRLSLDGDPGAGTDFSGAFDPINGAPYFDHGIGDNGTAEGGGSVAPWGNATAYSDLIANGSLAQNSWNYEFFNETTDGLFVSSLSGFDPNRTGVYTIKLEAFDENGATLAASSIDINVVPLPAGALLIATAFAGAGVVSRLGRRRAG